MPNKPRNFDQLYCATCGVAQTPDNSTVNPKTGNINNRRCKKCAYIRRKELGAMCPEDKPWYSRAGGNAVAKCPVCGEEKPMQRGWEHTYIYCGINNCNAKLDHEFLEKDVAIG